MRKRCKRIVRVPVNPIRCTHFAVQNKNAGVVEVA